MEILEIFEYQRKVMEMKGHLNEVCKKAVGEDQRSVT